MSDLTHIGQDGRARMVGTNAADQTTGCDDKHTALFTAVFMRTRQFSKTVFCILKEHPFCIPACTAEEGKGSFVRR